MATLAELKTTPATDWLNAYDISRDYRLPVQLVWKFAREEDGPLHGLGHKLTRKVTIYRRSEVEIALGLVEPDENDTDL